MLRHIAMFRLKDDAPEGTLQSLSEGLSRLVQSISEISIYSYGGDLGLREGNFDFAVVADFENAEAFASYVNHPDHQAFIQNQLTPVVAERVALQFELSASKDAL
jgi:hypothetical protein